jgi:hypothetical protein
VRIRVRQANLRQRQLDFDMVGKIDFETGHIDEIGY